MRACKKKRSASGDWAAAFFSGDAVNVFMVASGKDKLLKVMLFVGFGLIADDQG